MKKHCIVTFITLYLTACTSLLYYEDISLDIDLTDWKVGHSVDYGKTYGRLIEFIPKGENIDSWSKLFQVQFIEQTLIDEMLSPLKIYSDEFFARRKKQCPKSEFEILSETDISRTYLSIFPSCAGHEEQSEITRLLQGNDGIHRISYAEKGKRLSQATIDEWNEKFQKAYIMKKRAF